MFRFFRGRTSVTKDPAELSGGASSVASATTGHEVSPRQRDWLDALTDEERDRIIESVAQGVVRHRMETAAILFLEMHKPVSFMASQGLVVLSPFTAPFIGMENVQLASKLIEKRENVELLIRRIEELSAEKEAEDRASKKIAREKSARHQARDEELDPAAN